MEDMILSRHAITQPSRNISDWLVGIFEVDHLSLALHVPCPVPNTCLHALMFCLFHLHTWQY
jgi:hypothetical protein